MYVIKHWTWHNGIHLLPRTVKERFVSRVLTSTSSTDDNGVYEILYCEIIYITMPYPVSHVFLDSTVVDEKKYMKLDPSV